MTESNPTLLLTYQPFVVECARCIAPGMCCKAFPLSLSFPIGSTPAKVKEILDNRVAPTLSDGTRLGKPPPFLPLRRQSIGADSEDWLFYCPKLKKDGRCKIYDRRPDTCRVYEPGSDTMCVHVKGENGLPLVPQRDA